MSIDAEKLLDQIQSFMRKAVNKLRIKNLPHFKNSILKDFTANVLDVGDKPEAKIMNQAQMYRLINAFQPDAGSPG